MRFVQKANLPEDAACLLLGKDCTDILRERLRNLGIQCLSIPKNPFLDSRIDFHADLSVLHLGQNRLLLAGYLKGSALAAELEGKGAVLSYLALQQKAKYPGDAGLNLCLIGDHVIANPKTAAPEALQTAISGRVLLPTRQGYSRCSVCVVDSEALITADTQIASAAELAGMHVLRISPGAVELPGFSSGFLGGASFKLSRSRIAFTGHLDDHPDQDAILAFLNSRAVEPVFLSDQPVFDIGSAIPIWEK